jgi:predicted MFS family arabinose efflux permease
MGLYSLMLSAGIAIGNVVAGVAFQMGGVQAVFYLGAGILSGMSLTSGFLLRRANHLATSASELAKTQSKPI